MKKQVIVAGLLALASASWAASGDNQVVLRWETNQTLTTLPGVQSDADGSLGFGAGVEYLRRISGNVELGSGLSYQSRSKFTSSKLAQPASADVSGDTLLALGLARFDAVNGDSELIPYIELGAGIARSTLLAKVNGQVALDDASLSAALMVRVGADVPLAQDVVLGLSASLTYLPASSKNLTPAAGGSRVSYVQRSVTFGPSIGYRF